ncbi:MAG: ABC transporter substrate binding protein [Xanthobacteraceae bacterium]
MRRREFITTLGFAAATAALPPAARAQQSKIARLGWVTTGSAASVNPFLDALRAGLIAHGYIEGRNLTIAARYADGDVGSVLPLAEELTRLPVDLIATQGTATRLLLKVSTTVPVVYVFSADPVLVGIADSLARPGRDMTGITVMSIELNGKRLELLREIMPQLRRVLSLQAQHMLAKNWSALTPWKWPKDSASRCNIFPHRVPLNLTAPMRAWLQTRRRR